MQIKFTVATDYDPQPTDSPRCYGQLQSRPSVVDGKCGPMVTYFPKGATPDLHDDVALAFIAAGVADVFVGPVVKYVTAAEILQDMATQ